MSGNLHLRHDLPWPSTSLVELVIFIYGLQGTARSYESEEEK